VGCAERDEKGAQLGRGDRKTTRWKKDRQRKKRLRDRRKIEAKTAERRGR
jgi:hypothetical protein